MAHKVAFGAADREALFVAVKLVEDRADQCDGGELQYQKTLQRASKSLHKLLEKMDRAGTKVDQGLSVPRYLEIAKEELGGRLALPPNPGAAFYGKLKARLRETGLDETSARRVVKAANRVYSRGPIEADFILYKATHLLASAGPAKPRVAGSGERKGPLPLGE